MLLENLLDVVQKMDAPEIQLNGIKTPVKAVWGKQVYVKSPVKISELCEIEISLNNDLRPLKAGVYRLKGRMIESNFDQGFYITTISVITPESDIAERRADRVELIAEMNVINSSFAGRESITKIQLSDISNSGVGFSSMTKFQIGDKISLLGLSDYIQKAPVEIPMEIKTNPTPETWGAIFIERNDALKKCLEKFCAR